MKIYLVELTDDTKHVCLTIRVHRSEITLVDNDTKQSEYQHCITYQKSRIKHIVLLDLASVTPIDVTQAILE